MTRIERGEEALAALGFSDFRIRLFHDAARLQIPEKQFEMLFQKRKEVQKALEPYFDVLLLDLEER